MPFVGSIPIDPMIAVSGDEGKAFVEMKEGSPAAQAFRDIVAAYDLLNEPLRTSRPNKPDTEYLHPELVRFYEDCIADIRASEEGREGVQSFLQKRKPAWLQA